MRSRGPFQLPFFLEPRTLHHRRRKALVRHWRVAFDRLRLSGVVIMLKPAFHREALTQLDINSP